jgi:hypothetical protein
MVPLASSSHVPPNVQKVIEGSLGGALGVAQRAPTKLGDLLAAVARHAFISGMDLALIISAVAVGVAAIVVLVLLPSRGVGPTNLGWTGTSAGSHESGQLDTWVTDPPAGSTGP